MLHKIQYKEYSEKPQLHVAILLYFKQFHKTISNKYIIRNRTDNGKENTLFRDDQLIKIR